MIHLYTYTTPNGRKPAILLEELGLPYTLHKVDLGKGEQFSPEFVALNPNSKIPAIKDEDTGVTVFESGAILIYLAEKTEKLLPTDAASRAQVMAWLMFQMAGVGPMFGQLGHFRRSAPEPIEYAINRYEQEALRLVKVLNRQLQERDFIAGEYSIADIATYPWVAAYEYVGLSLDPFPHVQAWLERVGQRPAVQTGMAILTPEFKSDLAQ
ncbi:glutathione S-transferase N-terminal domain-containing protein [Acaryochloris marina]|uniref:Glutathione S-transferase n=1 Tax=Acaryochloris marina (strain MBIC 11017) TaxID=329726 RepID=B0C407_ACAM1|nr:glutathione S-transferase N-terminal domain-containing protein [Acaryochloris marina]ABW26267.1 glutathione S-transferase [Acaryochloris marina MBIC11017]BDM81094.1 thiol:disulfide oxidoreductase [Acaryochloris marina MBIC10699]